MQVSPSKFVFDDDSDITLTQCTEIKRRLNLHINQYPTIMYTRNHISKRTGPLKQRPVYAVDDLFLTIETMLTFPLLVQARHHDSCIMYGLEAIRKSNVYLDLIVQKYKSFFTIDWSSFDQTVPRCITGSTFRTSFQHSIL